MRQPAIQNAGSSRAPCQTRIGGADEGKRRQYANVVEYAPPDPVGCLRVMLGDVSADVLEIRNRRV